MTPTEYVLAKLPDAKRNGSGWSARCPAHDDQRASLSIGEGDDGRALLRCHAGCTAESIVTAVGLTMRDLMPDNGRSTPTTPQPAVKPPRLFASAAEAVKVLENRHGPKAAYWTYNNANGEPCGVVVRWNRPDGTKDIRPVARRDGGWIIGAMRTPRPIYHLPEIREAGPETLVYVCEGEKCSDAMMSLGLTATTSAGGSAAAKMTDWTPLSGRTCIILPDCDEPGEKYAADVVGLLQSVGAASVRIVRLPGLAEHEDVADWIPRQADNAAALAELRRLVDAAPVVEREADEAEAHEADPWTPFPIDLLPEPLGQFVTETASAIGCDPAFMALPVLAVVGGVIGMTCEVELKGSWSEPPIVWGAIIARSGTLKSPALDAATLPLRRMQADALRDHQRAMESYAQAVLDAKARKALPPDPPMARRFVVSDCTIESLAPILEKNPRGLILVRDELSAWFGSFNAYKARGRGNDAAQWLELHRGGTLIVDRKGADKPTIFVPRAAVSLIGTIQPGVMSAALSGEYIENGLAARLLLVRPPDKIKRWTDRTPSRATTRAYADLILRLAELQPGDGEHGPEPRRLPLSAAAMALWGDWYNDHAKQIAEAPTDAEAAVLAKIEAYGARLALIVAIAADPNAVVVSGEAMERGIRLANWFAYESRRVYAAMSETDEDRDQQDLIRWIRGHGGAATPRDLTHRLRRFKGNAGEARQALDDLVRTGLGRWTHDKPDDQGGRPAARFALNPVPETLATKTAPVSPVSKTLPGAIENEGYGYGDSGDASASKAFGDAPAPLADDDRPPVSDEDAESALAESEVPL